jgi:GST-like protein
MQFAASTVYTAVGVADYPARWTTSNEESAHKAVEAAAVARMKLGWEIVADAYAGTQFFLGERPFICDVYLANLSKWWKMRDYLKVQKPAFAQLMARVDDLPEVGPVWQRHWS